MRFQYLFGLAATIFLSACITTPEKLVVKQPEVVYSSTKSPKVIAECVAAGWENVSTVNVRSVGDGFRVKLYLSRELIYMADIEPLGTGSRTTVWKNITAIGSRPPWYDTPGNCQ